MYSKDPDQSALHPQSRLLEDHELPRLERFLKKLRFFDSKYNFIYMVILALGPYIYDYLICRRYWDKDECRSQRDTASHYSGWLLFLYFIRVRYLKWGWKRKQEAEMASAAST